VAAAGLLELADRPELDARGRARYRGHARQILQSLSTRYLAERQREGILREATPDGPSHTSHLSMMPADYFFLDGLRRLVKKAGILCTAAACELEAESARVRAADLVVHSDLIAYLQLEPASRPRPAEAAYDFTTTAPATFALHAVLRAPRGSTLRVAVDGEPAASAPWSIPATATMQDRLVSGATGEPGFTLGPGPHVLRLLVTGPGVAIDKLILERRPTAP
jgi:hypothetical protein